MILIMLILVVLILFYFYLKMKPTLAQVGPFLPDWYLGGITVYAIGSSYLSLQGHVAGANDVALIALTTLISALFGTLTFTLLHKRHYNGVHFIEIMKHQNAGKWEIFGSYFGIIFASLIAVFFVYLVLSNSVIGALLSAASLSGDSTITAARKAITSGSEGYFAPGYVKQFRDILIPIFLISIMFLHIKKVMSSQTKFIIIFAFSSALLAVLISGQRFITIVVLITTMMGWHYYTKAKASETAGAKLSYKGPIILLTIVGMFYFASTILLGRVSGDASALDLVGGVIEEFLSRVFLSLPEENMATYPFWGAIGPTMGGSWMGDLMQILPGIEGISFANRLHELLGGSDQGNSPLGLAVDVWFAWGWAGVILIPFIYGVLWGMLDLLLMSERSAIFGGLKIYLAFVCPMVLSPFGFILNGGAVAIVLISFVKTLRYIRQRSRGQLEQSYEIV